MTVDQIRDHMERNPGKDLFLDEPRDPAEANRIACELHNRFGILAGVRPEGRLHVYAHKPRQH